MTNFSPSARLLLAALSLALSAPLAHAQSAAASQNWARFVTANPGWSVEWSASGDQAESMRGKTVAASGSPLQIAEDFISRNKALLGLANGSSDLSLASEREEGGDTHLQYQQTYAGRPVFNGFVDVHLNRDGQIYLVNNSAVSASVIRSISLQPAFAAQQAGGFAQARQQTFYDKKGVPFTLALSPIGQPRLGIQKTDTGARLAYLVNFGPVAYVIDAGTGATLDTILYMLSGGIELTASKVFDPNPVNTLNDNSLLDQNDTNYSQLQGGYFTRPLHQINRTGSGTSTRFALVGPFVRTLDLKASSVGTCMNGQSEVRKPPVKSTTAMFTVNRHSNNFEHVIVYFHIDRSQRHIQDLGINNNFNSALRIDGHGLTIDNSFYCASPVGGGYIAMGDGGVDDAEDADVVLHEYGHALQDNASNGRYLTNGEAGAMGEGFGDYWAYAAKSSGPWAACFAEWDTEFASCLRRLDTNKHYPEDVIGQVHADGEIWSQGLRGVLIRIGRTKADTIILKSHFLIPAAPNFSKGVTALVNADAARYGGANKNAICAAFAARGITPPICS